jgi:hypothetical protein
MAEFTCKKCSLLVEGIKREELTVGGKRPKKWLDEDFPFQLLSKGAPSGSVELAAVGTRLHPGGGSEGHRRPKAEEAVARGILPPPDKL